MQKITQKDLEQKINNQSFQNVDVYYSLADKEGSTFGMNKQRLLVFSRNSDELFYLVSDQKVPFGKTSNFKKSNKDIAIVSTSLFENPPKTNKLIVKYSAYNDKKQKVMRQWTFTMKKQGLAQDWCEMLNDHKTKKLKGVQNPRLVGNTVIAQLQKDQKKQNEIDDQDIAQSFFLNNSNVKYTKQQPQNKNDPNQGIHNSNLRGSNLRGSNLRQPTNINNPNSVINNSTNQNKPNNSTTNINNQPNNSNIRQSQNNLDNNNNNSRMRQSKKPQNQKQVKNDWNYKFFRERQTITILEFQDQCQKLLNKYLSADKSSDLSIRKYESEFINAYFTDVGTQQAHQLKQQFRNYHYIVQCCRDNPILGVPLCCLIQIYGLVALFKANFPQKAPKIRQKMKTRNQLMQLEELTKINNDIIFYSECVLLDLTQLYGTNGQHSTIYVDNLVEYLPQINLNSNSKQLQETYMIRPQLIQFNVDKIIAGGHLDSSNQLKKYRNQLQQILKTEIADTADFLSKEEIYITNIFDLKQFLHYRGVNLKMMDRISQKSTNKFIKKYVDTSIAAKIVKDQINNLLCNVFSNQNAPSAQKILQGEIRSYIQGKSASNSQNWKKIALIFRKKYGYSLNTHDLLGAFFLSCLMTLIPASYDMKRLNKQKIIFEDKDIIGQGFVTKIQPKLKTYYRFQGQPKDRVIQICKYSPENRKIFQEIVQLLQLQKNQIPDEYDMNQGKIYVMAYLSDYIPPKKLQPKTLPCAQEIYDNSNILCQPPSTPSIKINLNYLAKCLEYKNYEQFKSLIQPSLDIIQYWLGPQHPQISQYYDKMSDYQASKGNIESCIKLLERSLEISKSAQSLNHKKIGKRYNALGSRYLKAGYKKQALINLQNSKKQLQKCSQQIPQHALTLLKLSSLYLNYGQMNKCVENGRQALIKAEKTNIKDSTTIRIFQILSRAYEINDDKQSFRKLSLECARKFNNSKQSFVFDQMIKIGLTGTFIKISAQKCTAVYQLAVMLQKQGKIQNNDKSLEGLMQIAQEQIVMQKFINKCQSADKILADVEHNNKSISAQNQEYLKILALVCGSVGLDFIQGLDSQKQFQ